MTGKLLPIVCDATVVLNLGHRGGLSLIAIKLKAERGLYVTPEVVREVSQTDPDFYAAFLAEHFITIGALDGAPPDCTELEDGLLDEGELSVLAVCRDNGWLAGIDELDGRKAARFLKIPLLGSLGIIDHAVKLLWMSEDEGLDVIRRLRRGGFHCPKVHANDDFLDYLARMR